MGSGPAFIHGQIYCGGKYRRTYRSKLTIAAVNQYILVYRREMLNLFLIYPTQTPLLHSGSRLDRSGGFGGRQPPTEKRSNLYDRIYMPHPTPSATASRRIFLTY